MSDPYLPEEDTPAEVPPAWGFRITLILLAIYLLYRLVQMAVWLVDWIGDRVG